MKTKFSLTLSLLFLLLAVLTACTPVEGVFDVQVEPAAPIEETQTEAPVAEIILAPPALEEVKAVALAMLGGSITNVLERTQLTTVPCTTADGLGGPPKCAEGETEGTEIIAFPSGSSEGAWIRQNELEDFLSFNLTLKGLYAVYRVTPSANAEPYWPNGEYALLFEREVNDFPIPITALVQDGQLVRLNFTVGQAPEAILKDIPVADILVAPHEVQAWLGLPNSLIPTRPVDEGKPTEATEGLPTVEPMTSSLAPGTNPGWLRYTISSLGLSFEVPATWIIDESLLHDRVVYVNPPDANPNIVYFYLSVARRGIEEVESIYRDGTGQLTPYTLAGRNGFQVSSTDYPRIEYLIPSQEIVLIIGTEVIAWPEIQTLLATFTLSR